MGVYLEFFDSVRIKICLDYNLSWYFAIEGKSHFVRTRKDDDLIQTQKEATKKAVEIYEL